MVKQRENALNLRSLLTGDTTFRAGVDQPSECDIRFLKLLPRKGLFRRFAPLTREELKALLINNRLVTPGKDPEVATSEALQREYCPPASMRYWADDCKFVEQQDCLGNVRYVMTGQVFG